MYTLFFIHHQLSSRSYICTFFLPFEKYLSHSCLYLPPSSISFYTIFTDTHCVHSLSLSLFLLLNGTCGGELFFRDVHSKDEKKLHSRKKRSEYFLSCTSSVFWITDIFSSFTTHFPFFCTLVAVRSYFFCCFSLSRIVNKRPPSESSVVLCVKSFFFRI